MATDQEKFFASLETKGEDQVRLDLVAPIYNERRSKLAHEWLAHKERKRDETDAQGKAVREVETISIAKEANRISKENVVAATISARSAQKQARWAMWAAVISTTAAIISAKDDLLKLLAKVL